MSCLLDGSIHNSSPGLFNSRSYEARAKCACPNRRSGTVNEALTVGAGGCLRLRARGRCVVRFDLVVQPVKLGERRADVLAVELDHSLSKPHRTVVLDHPDRFHLRSPVGECVPDSESHQALPARSQDLLYLDLHRPTEITEQPISLQRSPSVRRAEPNDPPSVVGDEVMREPVWQARQELQVSESAKAVAGKVGRRVPQFLFHEFKRSTDRELTVTDVLIGDTRCRRSCHAPGLDPTTTLLPIPVTRYSGRYPKANMADHGDAQADVEHRIVDTDRQEVVGTVPSEMRERLSVFSARPAG